MIGSDIFNAVGELLRDVAAIAVLPRFAVINPADIEIKAPGELVTWADRQAETLIGRGLLGLLGDSRVVGEEACAADPSLLSHLDTGWVWIVDPIDGTANFAAGRAPFAMMIALLKEGETVASWILDPLADRLAVAERGGGAWIGGRRLSPALFKGAPDLGELRGIVSDAFCPPERKEQLQSFRKRVGVASPTARCAGHEYPLIAAHQYDFALYWRTLVWDHAPGALLLTEAGGSVTFLDGTPYRPTNSRSGLILATQGEVSRRIARDFPCA